MKLSKIIFILLNVITTCFSTLLVEKTAFLVNSVFKESMPIIVWWHNSSDDVTEFIKLYGGDVILIPAQNNSSDIFIIRKFHKKIRYLQTVVFADSIEEVKYFIKLQHFVIPIRLLVILKKAMADSELSTIMATAWENDVADILVVSCNTEHVMLTTYFPYSNGKCGDFTPVYLDQNTNNFFPEKFVDFQGCEIRTSILLIPPLNLVTLKNDTFESLSGIDGNMINILFKLLNATIKVIPLKDHGDAGTLVNGTATGSFGDLLRKQTDIISPTLIMSHLRYPYTQCAHVSRSISIHWFGPRRRELSEWLRALQPFMSNITPVLFISFILFIVAMIVIRRFEYHRSFARDSIIFQSFVIFLGYEVNFVTKSRLTNSLFMLWIWFCMIVRIAYQGDLVQCLENTIVGSPLGSFEEAIKKVEGYGGIEILRDYYNGTQYYNDYKIIGYDNIFEDIKAVGAGKSFLIAADKLLALITAPDLQILSKDPLIELPACFHMRPGWPAAAYIDNLLLRMVEVGFTQKVMREHTWKKRIRLDSDHDSKSLTMRNLIGIFYGLGFMYIICIVVFILEIIRHKRKLCTKIRVCFKSHD